MKVSELIEFLKKQPQDLPVAYHCCSEQALLEASEIVVIELCKARIDGWVANERPDKKKVPYLVFPGN